MEGDLIYQDYQYEFRGLLMGAGTDIIVEEFDGLLSMADLESGDVPNMHGHGSFPGRDRLVGKVVNGTLRPKSTKGPNIEDLIDDIAEAFQSSDVEEPLVFKRPGRAKRRVNVRCRRRSVPTSYDLANGLGLVEVEMAATDPRVYSNDEYMESAQILPGENSKSLEVWNEGNLKMGTQPILEIEGPCLNPTISNNGDGNKQIYINLNVPAGQVLEIDVRNRSVKLDGTSVYGPNVVLPATRWWSLLPKLNQVTLLRSGTGGTSEIRVRWRNAFS